MARALIGNGEYLERRCLAGLAAQARWVFLAVGEEGAKKINACLIGTESIVQGLGDPVTEQRRRIIEAAGVDRVVVQLNRGGEVVEGFDLVGLGDGGEVVAEAGVGALLVGQTLIGVLAGAYTTYYAATQANFLKILTELPKRTSE